MPGCQAGGMACSFGQPWDFDVIHATLHTIDELLQAVSHLLLGFGVDVDQ